MELTDGVGRRAGWSGLLVALALAGYLGWELLHRSTYAYHLRMYTVSDADEWRYTACSRLVEHGYRLFSDVFSAQPPLLFVSLAIGMRATSDSILGARYVEIGWGAIAIIAVAVLGRELAGTFAGAVAGIALVLAPGFLLYSHTVEAEVPMMALAALGLALAAAATSRDSLTLALLGGLCLAAAVLTKLFALEAVAPACWLLWSGRGVVSRRIQGIAILLAGVIVPVVVEFVSVARAQQWRQVVQMHEAAAKLHLPGAAGQAAVLLHFALLNPILSMGAAVGFGWLVVQRRDNLAIFCALWALGSVFMLVTFHPLFDHHTAILLAPLALCVGLGAREIGGALRYRHAVLAFLIAAAVALVGCTLVVRRLFVASEPPNLVALSFVVARPASPGELIAVDDLRIADASHRLVVPPLCDPSNVRLQSGYLTDSDAINATRQYHPEVVVSSFGLFRQLKGYTSWLATHYDRRQEPQGAIVYIRR